MSRQSGAGAWVKRILLRIVLVLAVFWGGEYHFYTINA